MGQGCKASEVCGSKSLHYLKRLSAGIRTLKVLYGRTQAREKHAIGNRRRGDPRYRPAENEDECFLDFLGIT